MTSIPGIIYIGTVRCENLLSDIENKFAAGIPVRLVSNVTKIPFFGIPTCDVEDEYDNNGHSESCKLKFISDVEISDEYPLAFVIKDIAGSVYIIGKKEKPFPIVKRKQTTGSPSGDSAVFTYEVTYTSLKGIIKCKV